MPIKELQFSFSISVEALAQALATSNSGMKVQVLGTEPEPISKLNGGVKALPPPRRGARHVILPYLQKHPHTTFTTREIVVICSNSGFNDMAAYNALSHMHRDRLIRKYGKGKYRISKAGLTHGG